LPLIDHSQSRSDLRGRYCCGAASKLPTGWCPWMRRTRLNFANLEPRKRWVLS
jgi:hypothetical protein